MGQCEFSDGNRYGLPVLSIIQISCEVRAHLGQKEQQLKALHKKL